VKKIYFLLFCFVSFNFLHAQWIYQYTSEQYSNFQSIKFTSENTGYAVGDLSFPPYALFAKTTNAGLNWVNMNISLSFETKIIELSFVNDNTGYICGRSVDIYKTTNGGINWQTINVPYFDNQGWSAIQFINENTGFLAGRYGMSRKTTNGGLSWICLDTVYGNVYDLYFVNQSTGFMADGVGYIYKTTDGGNNWITSLLLDTNGIPYTLQKIDFNDNIGFIVGLNTEKGVIFKTTDLGNSWKNIAITSNGLFGLKVLSNSIVYAGGQNKTIYYSTNSGKIWTAQIIPTTKQGIGSIYFTSTNTGYLTVNNEIYKTTNGGVGILNITNEIPDRFSLSQNCPNPFNPSTNIKFDLPNNVFVSIKTYDLLGREIKTLVNEYKQAGTYLVSFNGSELASGTYFYRIQAGSFVQVKRMLLIK